MVNIIYFKPPRKRKNFLIVYSDKLFSTFDELKDYLITEKKFSSTTATAIIDSYPECKDKDEMINILRTHRHTKADATKLVTDGLKK